MVEGIEGAGQNILPKGPLDTLLLRVDGGESIVVRRQLRVSEVPAVALLAPVDALARPVRARASRDSG